MSATGAAPSFSIVIPTYQRRELVCEAVQHIDALEYGGSIEIVVVVDGSTDGTAAALGKLRARLPIRIIEQSNAGAGAARNRGAACASGEIILFSDDDMIVQSDLVGEHARMYREGADAVIGQVLIDDASPPGFVAEGFVSWLRSCRIESHITPFEIWTAQLSVRRKVFEHLGGFDESFTANSMFSQEDADFGVKLLARFQVRHNPLAVSRLRYIVTAREQMERTAKKAAGDVHFAVKYPELSRQLWDTNGVSRPATRFIYRPLSHVPLLPKVLGEIATRVAEAGLRTRFRSNLLLARFFNAARAISYWAAVSDNGGIANSSRLLILCYHSIRDNSEDPILAPFAVRRELFKAHLDSLSSRGFVFVGPDSLAAFAAGAPLPSKAVLVTFDDCYEELLTIAREELRPRGIAAIAFPVTGVKSATNEWDQAQGARLLRLLSPAQLRQLQSLGVEIGCHSRTHRDLTLLTDSEREAEISGAAADLVGGGLPRPRFFAYPYGLSDGPTREAVRRSGFLAGFGLANRYASRSSDAFDLPRVMMNSGDAGWRFRLRSRFPLLHAHLRQRVHGL